MKTQFLFLTLCSLFSFSLFAQKIKIKGDMVLKDGEPYIQIVKNQNTYSVQNLEGKELIFVTLIRYPIGDEFGANLLYRFVETGEEGEETETSLSSKKQIAKQLAKFKVIDDAGAIVPNAKASMLSVFAAQEQARERGAAATAATPAASPGSSNYVPSERNRRAPIFVFGDNIKQDDTEIARIKKSSKADRGQILDLFQVYAPTGQLLAEGEMEKGSENLSILTFKDNRRHSVSLQKAGISVPQQKEAIAEKLISLGYL